jgi:hypothetical protein
MCGVFLSVRSDGGRCRGNIFTHCFTRTDYITPVAVVQFLAAETSFPSSYLTTLPRERVYRAVSAGTCLSTPYIGNVVREPLSRDSV